MCPRAVTKRKLQSKQQTQLAKLWLLLIGVNQYSDAELPSLQYSALDCQGLGEALTEATATFPAREIILHHDFANSKPELSAVSASLERILADAQPDDTVLIYFSGHGILDKASQQVYLCLRDTKTDRLQDTGLPLQEILQRLGSCPASQQLVWLDACHSGGMTLRGTDTVVPNPTKQLVQALRLKAQQSKGFYALLSCDQTQQSWEFPELGHGVFTYYLMRGLRGEAADSQGIIEADALYQYVYHQTLRYIDRSNQQIRLINQQKSSRGERKLQTEYPLQTPKRIVEGFGKVVIGQQGSVEQETFPRQALVVDGMGSNPTTMELSKVLRGKGDFELGYFPPKGKQWQDVKDAIASCLYDTNSETEITTAFLYLRGKIRHGNKGGEAYLVFRDGAYISQEWLRKILHNSPVTQQIVIIDCPDGEVVQWVEELKVDYDRGQCIIAAQQPLSNHQPEEFTQALITTLQKSDPKNGLSVAAWISQLQLELAGSSVTPQIWLSGTRGVIEVLPARASGNKAKDSTILDINVCPYVGLQAFTEDNAQYFYGREGLVQKLVNHLQHHNTLAVVGASGSGKSSVVQAGLFCQLRGGRQIPNSNSWMLKSFRPGVKPYEALARCLVSEGTAQEKAQARLQIEGLLYQGVEGFAQWLRTRTEPRIVLAVDQFEELFTLTSEADRYQFITLLLQTVRYCSDRFSLIFTIRADFVATCLEIPELAEILQQKSVLVPPYLTEADYRHAIVKPANQVGLKVEPSLVEILLQELDGATGDLPLLQFVLQKLWENRTQGTLTLDIYKKLGGVKGALEHQAQELYESLSEAEQDCAKWIFLNLTKIGEGTEDTRRRVTKSDLIVTKYPAQLVEKTLQKLTAAKLIVTNLDNGLAMGRSRSSQPQDDDKLLQEAMQQEATVEVVHEILIRHWTTLRWWLEENRARLQLQRQIEQSAILWQKKHKQPDFLLKGVRLAEAEDLYIKYNDELTNTAQDFLAACIEERLKEQNTVKKRLRRTQMTAAGLGILTAATTVLGGLSYLFFRSAQTQSVKAQLQEINALNESSEALLNSGKQLESVIASIKAGKQLQEIQEGTSRIDSDLLQQTRFKTATTLQQAIYGTQEVNRLESHSQQVNSVAHSPDGKLIATASDDKTVKLWTAEGELLDSVENSNGVTTVSFLPAANGYALVSASGNTATIWQITDSKLQQLNQLSGHDDLITDVATVGYNIATASRDGTIKLWTTAGELVTTLSNGSEWISTIEAMDNYLISGDAEGKVTLWDIAKEVPVNTIQVTTDSITDIAVNNETIAVATDYGAVSSLTINSGELSNLQEIIPSGNGVANSITLTSYETIAVATDKGINVYSLDGILQQSLSGHNGSVLDLTSPPAPLLQGEGSKTGINNKLTLTSAGVDKTARIWQLSPILSTDDGGIYSVAVSPTDSNVIATAGFDGVKIWQQDKTDNSKKLITTLASNSTAKTITYSNDGKLLVTASGNNIQLWDTANNSTVATLQNQATIDSLALTSDNRFLISGSEDSTVTIWNLENKQQVASLTEHTDSVKTVAISPNNNYIASAGYDNKIKVWNLKGELLQSEIAHNSAVNDLVFTPDGNTLISASWDNSIKLWNVQASGEINYIKTLSRHQDGVTELLVNKQGDLLVSASSDRTIKLWSLPEGKLIKTLQGHSSQINSIAFTNNEQSIISTDEQQGLYWWDLELDSLLTKGCGELTNYLEFNSSLEVENRNICD